MLSADLPFPKLVDEIDRINSVNAYKSLLSNADRSDVCINPFDVSVYYDFSLNRIVIPTAALHSSYFGLNYPRAYNYGALGYIIAREMLRGFDHQGKDFDAEGNYGNWLPGNKIENFTKRMSCLSEKLEKENGEDVDGKSLDYIATSEGLKLAFKTMVIQTVSRNK
ncbi:peptidase family M13 [Ancylostoma duodenale]|uniref:Peptidase family M13 n=1 Tax=Ancylostoma duodenale TaxID=51022 RepID=A0A0C2GCH6_9BILA|nr:peptidase family M13 [Ancylostoma duodenale]